MFLLYRQYFSHITAANYNNTIHSHILDIQVAAHILDIQVAAVNLYLNNFSLLLLYPPSNRVVLQI